MLYFDFDTNIYIDMAVPVINIFFRHKLKIACRSYLVFLQLNLKINKVI